MSLLKTYRFHASLKELETYVKTSVFEHKIDGTYLPCAIVTKRSGLNRSESGYGGILCAGIFFSAKDQLSGRIRFRSQGLASFLGFLWAAILLWSIASMVSALI